MAPLLILFGKFNPDCATDLVCLGQRLVTSIMGSRALKVTHKK